MLLWGEREGINHHIWGRESDITLEVVPLYELASCHYQNRQSITDDSLPFSFTFHGQMRTLRHVFIIQIYYKYSVIINTYTALCSAVFVVVVVVFSQKNLTVFFPS